MEFLKESHETYQQAHALAARSLAKAKKHGLPACPAALNALTDDKLISYRLDLGILDIPVSLIVGVAEANENTALYTKEFFPLSLPKSEFADQWRDINKQYFCEKGLRGEIRCFEYLGKFYVCDGMKRVSVLKFHNVPTVRSHVTRIMPISTETKSLQQYYEFLSNFRLTNLYQLQFTQPGYFEKFQRALGKKATCRWTDSDRAQFLVIWPGIECAFRESYDDNLRITAADATVVLLQRYSFDQIVHMEPWMLARVFQLFWKELYALSFPDRSLIAGNIRPTEILQFA